MSPSGGKISEQETRYSLIDPQLKKAGWNLSDRTQVGFYSKENLERLYKYINRNIIIKKYMAATLHSAII